MNSIPAQFRACRDCAGSSEALMKLKLQTAAISGFVYPLCAVLFVFVLVQWAGLAAGALPDPQPPVPPDKEKVSYAMGMNLGFQRKESSTDVSTDVFVEGLKDALEG